MSANLGLCQVCNTAPAIGVACSSLGPMSLAYCNTCAAYGAEPYGLAAGIAASMGADSLDDFAEWIRPFIWATVLQAGETSDQWWADVAAELARQVAELEVCS